MNSYEEKQERQRERYEELAEKNREKSAAEYKKADLSESATGIPFGQPILCGHHSEGRHRKTLERADNAMRRSIEADKKADHYASKAAGVGTGGISSDDPAAIGKLLEKIEKAEKIQHEMKACNKIERGTFAPYQLSNNNANIRRMRQRVEDLRALGKVEDKTTKVGDVEIRTNPEINRTQVLFPDKPPAEIRQQLKSYGFRWSRYEGAWQRHISNAAQYYAEIVARAYCDWSRPAGES